MTKKAILLLVMLAGRAFGAIAYDNSSQSAGYSTAPISWSHTVGSAADSGVLVYIMSQPDSTDLVAGVTVGGVPMTRVSYCPSTARYSTLYVYWLASPTPGSQVITVSWSGQYWATAEVSVSYSGTSQLVPTAACNSLNAVNFPESVTTATNNSWVVGCAYSGGNGVSPGTGTTLRANSGGFTGGDKNAPTTPAGSAVITFNQGGGAQPWVGVSLELAAYLPPSAVRRTGGFIQ